MPARTQRSEQEQVEHKQAVNSVLRTLDVIDALAAAGRPVTLKALAEQLDRPVGSIHRLLRTLELRGHVINVGGRYRLSLKMWMIGESVIASIDVVEEARPVSKRLCDELQETVNLAVRSGTSAIYVTKLEAPRSLTLVTRLGLEVPVYCTALGKALIAFEPDATREEIVRQIEFRPHLQNTVTDPNALRADLERTRERGYAIDDEEFDPRIVCIGAPVFDHVGGVAAAISTSAPRDRYTPQLWPTIGRSVMRAAEEISLLLGYRYPERARGDGPDSDGIENVKGGSAQW